MKFNVRGINCAACVAKVEKAISRVPGVASVSVNLLTGTATVDGTAAPDEIATAVKNAGYVASLSGAETNETQSDADALQDRETPKLIRRLILSLVFLAPLFYVASGVGMFGFPLPKILSNPGALGLTQLLLSGALIVVNRRFFSSGLASLWRRAPNMDALVAIGSGAAFAFGVATLYAVLDAVFSGNAADAELYAREFYFETAGMILALITVGKTLEARAKGKTTSALKSLMKLAPETATVERDGVELTVPVKDVKKGDVFVVRPGERVAVDGRVLSGESAVDESALTGESVPIDKAPGDAVSSGTLNASGFLRCEATRVGEETTLAQIVRLTTDAAATKAPISRLADRVASLFVPTVIAIAAATFAVWLAVGETLAFALARGISVLVVSCPCALGLATPAAIVVGTGVGAKRGLLFKTAQALEISGNTSVVALDKTGVVTEGRPKTTDVFPASGVDENELLRVAVSLETKSEHPLARAVVEYAASKNVAPDAVENFRAVAGNGLTANSCANGETLAGGKRDFIAPLVGEISNEIARAADAFANDGKTPLYFARGGRLLGIVAVADAVRPDAAAAIKALQNLGLRVAILTGDVRRVAEAVARQVGVDANDVFAELLPNEKERVVRELQLESRQRVAFVGDGINDAPALARADVGIAVGSGTDVAIDAADVVLLQNRLADLPAAIRLSRATLKNIRENLFWAFAYNVAGIPLAAGVYVAAFGWKLSPSFGALAMSLSSFCVVSNALRLNFFNPNDASRDKPRKKNSSKKTPSRSNAASVCALENSASETDVAPLETNDAKTFDANNLHVRSSTKMQKKMTISGMMCGHCEARVKKTLENLPEVESAEVSFQDGTALVRLAAPVDDAVLKSAVEAQDYVVSSIE